MNSELVPVRNVLATIFEKIETAQKNEVALPPREKRLPDESIMRLRAAIGYGWRVDEICGPWTSDGEYGFRSGPVLDFKYQPIQDLTHDERVAIVNEARRGASRTAIGEHISMLAAHRRYNGAQGFTFVMGDLMGYIGHLSELAIRNAMDVLKLEDSGWFPHTREIVRECEWQQKKIDRLAETVKQ